MIKGIVLTSGLAQTLIESTYIKDAIKICDSCLAKGTIGKALIFMISPIGSNGKAGTTGSNIACGNVLSYHDSSTDYRPDSNCHTLKNNDARTDKYIFHDLDELSLCECLL